MTNKKEEKNGLIGARVLIGHVANDGGRGESVLSAAKQTELSCSGNCKFKCSLAFFLICFQLDSNIKFADNTLKKRKKKKTKADKIFSYHYEIRNFLRAEGSAMH